ncbi:CoA-transferase family III [Gonapodya prolifera JEL478]|uniref:CoA-transferase family III n=1 Tax=Gonapodya prolifera (strain JEL478) TaxID=1344416 RepID=A0A139AA36_GONPJ|nr:CoA-transferase family III [Gonapodya prolifera JEL478]|eukprot:KXS13549.1 CoA-transferase family III [Gonapodya prolifera JEL478]
MQARSTLAASLPRIASSLVVPLCAPAALKVLVPISRVSSPVPSPSRNVHTTGNRRWFSGTAIRNLASSAPSTPQARRKDFLGADDLSGLLVVSIDQAVAAPLCAAKLADAGARVIKVERKGEGDFARGYDRHVRGQDSSYFVWLNRGKESVALDLKDPNDLRLLDRMISKADVFIQNLAPGATSRMKVDGLGFGSKALRQRYPRLITVDMSGYGERGPLKDMKAYDMLVQGESGLITLSGARVGISLCDIGCGLSAYSGVLQALYHRERTGKGRGVEVSLYHALSDWTNPQLLMYTEGGFASKPSGIHHPGLAPYGAYRAGDGLEVLISIQNEREWANLATKVLNRPELTTDPRFNPNTSRVKNRKALDEIILDAFGKLTRADLIAKLEAAQIAYGRMSTLDDLAAHPQNRYIKVGTQSGKEEVTLLGPGTQFVDEEHEPEGLRTKESAEWFGIVPGLDEHGTKIREEFSS